MEPAAVTDDGDGGWEADGKERPKTSQLQRSVAFDLPSAEDTEVAPVTAPPVRRVTISDVRIDNSGGDLQQDREEPGAASPAHKDSTSIKKEIIGILKPPTLKKELKSFPSLPECFLHDLGLLDNLALSAENLSDQDIESKFSSLSLAFKTDRITLAERLELQHRQRDIAERNAEDEIRQLKSSVQCLNRLCHQADTREVLRCLEKQVGVLHQSLQRVSSSSEQFGAVQQEGRVAAALEIVLLHVDNLKRAQEREHHELEEARRVLVEHKLLLDTDTSYAPRAQARHRSVSVVQPASLAEPAKPRRASLGLNPSSQRQHLEVGSKEARPRSPAAARKVSQNSCLTTVKEDFDKAGSSAGDKLAVFGPIAESGEGKQGGGGGGGAKHDDNNNNGVENMNKTGVNGASALAAARRKESRKTSHFDIDTIMEEIDDLAVKRDSSPNKQSKPLPKTPTEFMQRKKSLLVQLQGWACCGLAGARWPYDEEETLLCVRYSVSAILTTAAIAVLLSTFIQ